MAQQLNSLKFGWLPRRYGYVCVLSLALAAAADAAPARIVTAGGQWAAIDFGSRCEARSKALWPKKGTEPFAGFAFARAGRQKGQFYVHLSRPSRDGATVIATIGGTPFLLAGKGQWAWSRSADQQQAMMRAARFNSAMRVESRGASGRIVDRYALSGAATAIDAAAAACAGKSGGA